LPFFTRLLTHPTSKSLRLPPALLPRWVRASRLSSVRGGIAAHSASDKKGIWGRKREKETKGKRKGSLPLCARMGFFSCASEINSSQGELCVVSLAIQVKLQFTPLPSGVAEENKVQDNVEKEQRSQKE